MAQQTDTLTETFIIGTSESCEAEYGSRAEGSAVTVIGFCNGEEFTVYGARTVAAAKAELLASGVEASQVSYL